MSGVSCKACGWILDWLESRSLDGDELYAASSALPAQSELRDPGRFVSWPEFLSLCSALRDVAAPVIGLGDTPVLTRVGRELGHRLYRTPAWRSRVRGSAPAALYTEYAGQLLSPLFSSLAFSAEPHKDGSLRIAIALPEDAGDASAFFELCAGMLEAAPELVGLPPCEAVIDIEASRARYRLAGSSALSSKAPWGATDHHVAEISLDVLGRRLAEAGNREAAARLLFELLRERFGYTVARLWAAGTPGEVPQERALTLLRSEGVSDKPPSRSLPLALGERPVGRLDLWDPDEATAELPELLEGLLPWFALLLDTAAQREAFGKTAPRPSEDRRLADLVRNTRDVVCEVREDGRISYVSPAVVELLGHPPGYFEGKSFIEFVAEQDRARRLASFANLQASGASEPVVFRSLHADGSPRWLEASAQPFRSSEGQHRVCCIVRDIDETKRSEGDLRARDELHRALLGNLDEVALVLDESGSILLGSGNAASYLGVPDSDSLLAEIMQRVHPGDRQAVSAAWHAASPDSPVKRVEFRLLDEAGSESRWFRGNWKPLHSQSEERTYSLVIRDITDRKHSERSLRALATGIADEAERFFPALAQHLAEALGCEIALVSLLDPERPERAQPVALWVDGELVAEGAYELEGTPCAKVLAGDLCCYPTGLAHVFSQDAFLVGEAIDSYVGIPLRLSDGSIAGHLCCMGRGPLRDPDLARSMIQIFGQRASAELQREHAVDALRKSEARYRTLAENARDIIVEATSESRVLYISPSAEEVLGYPLDELLDGNHLDLVHPDDVEGLQETFRRMIETQQGDQIVFRTKHRDGDWRWMDANARTFDAADGTLHIVASLREITQRALAEQQREQLISIIQNSSDLIGLTSLDGSLLFLNAAGQSMLGLESEAEVGSKSLYDFLSPDDSREMQYKIMPSVHRSRQWSNELVLHRFKSGRPIATLANLFLIYDHSGASPVAVAAICRDISERKKFEQDLLESEERYRMLAENPYDLISELDERGRFVYASPNYETILGLSPSNLLGRDAISLIHPVDRDEIAEGYRDTIENETTRFGSFRAAHRDGHYVWMETTARAYRTADDRVMAVMISRDISERIDAAEALRESQEKLRQAQKMEAIGRLAGGIAHDFNNLLTAITGYCDLLLEEIDSEGPARSDAEEILKASESASALTHQLLAFSRRQVLKPRILELDTLVSDVDRMLRRLIGEHISLRSVLEGDLWPVKADPGQIQQVIVNLVVNARDAMSGGGDITIETANVTIGPDDERPSHEMPPGSYVSLSVRDTGTGMSQETQDLIFEPFFTTKESDRGTGLGLSTVFGIVRQSGGHLFVDSSLGEGSTFTLYLPRATEVDAAPEIQAPQPLFRGSETVLLVEDAAPVRKLVDRYLRRHGYTVLEAASGIEALGFCHGHEGPIHLLLTDVVMPGMGGPEIARRVRELRHDTRVVYMSGFSDESLARHGLSSESIVQLEKPFTPATLLQVIRTQLDLPDEPRGPGDEDRPRP